MLQVISHTPVARCTGLTRIDLGHGLSPPAAARVAASWKAGRTLVRKAFRWAAGRRR